MSLDTGTFVWVSGWRRYSLLSSSFFPPFVVVFFFPFVVVVVVVVVVVAAAAAAADVVLVLLVLLLVVLLLLVLFSWPQHTHTLVIWGPWALHSQVQWRREAPVCGGAVRVGTRRELPRVQRRVQGRILLPVPPQHP